MDNINVLIVEDESIVALDLKNTLSKLNYNVLDIATSGAGAISKAKELNPDVILMDIMLKGDMDGITACKEINSRLDIPIIYLTAYSDMNTLKRAEKTNYYSYILKPFDEKDLCIKLRMAVYYHKLNKEFNNRLNLIYNIFQSLNEPVIILNKDSEIIFLNNFLLELTNHELEFFIGKDISFIIKNFDEKNNFCNISNNKFIQIVYENENNKIIYLKKYLNEDFNILEDKINKLCIELNNILTLIVGNMELCKIKADTSNYEFYKLLKDTQEKVNNVKKINNNLIDFDIKYNEDKIIDLKQFILEKFFYIKNITFEKTSFNIKIDKLLLFKVINSVIKNSFEAIKSDKDEVHLKISKNYPYIRIDILDTGIGISQENINKIFEPFFTTKENHKGLGLTISKIILKMYGGQILVESIPNKETKFTILIPEYK
jgi:signal transduction histidine kinase